MLNPNEAPEGYVAVNVARNECISACTNCAFDMQTCDDIPCSGRYRQDKTNVYFIKKETNMNKPPITLVPDSINWDHVHPDYKYMAKDVGGNVYLYECLPIKGNNEWDVYSCNSKVARADAFISVKVGTMDWKDSLVTRP